MNEAISPETGPKLLLHGWDSSGAFWHGPTEIRGVADHAGILRRLGPKRETFHGMIRCRVAGCPSMEFQTAVYDLSDSGLAIVHSAGATGQPLGALAVIPERRRARIREEFAFGFASFLSFLGGIVTPESDLAIHDYVDEALRTTPDCSVGFAVQRGDPGSDADVVLSAYMEKLSIAMLLWLSSREGAGEEEGRPCFLLSGDGNPAGARDAA